MTQLPPPACLTPTADADASDANVLAIAVLPPDPAGGAFTVTTPASVLTEAPAPGTAVPHDLAAGPEFALAAVAPVSVADPTDAPALPAVPEGARIVWLDTTAEDHLVAWFAALAITVHIAEAALPSPLPGVKPGLANVVTLVLLERHGWRIAAWVAGLRVLVGSLLIGTFLSPTFLLSAAGAAGSLAVLGLARRPGCFGPIGYGVLAACAHMAAQFAVARGLLIPHAALSHLLPPLMTVAVATGLASGIIAGIVLDTEATPPPS